MSANQRSPPWFPGSHPPTSPTEAASGGGSLSDVGRPVYPALPPPPLLLAENPDRSGGAIPVLERAQNDHRESVPSANQSVYLAQGDFGYVSEALPIDNDSRSSAVSRPVDGSSRPEPQFPSKLTSHTDESSAGDGPTTVAPNNDKKSVEAVLSEVGQSTHILPDLARSSMATEGQREYADSQSSESTPSTRSAPEPILSPKPLNYDSFYGRTFSPPETAPPQDRHGGGPTAIPKAIPESNSSPSLSPLTQASLLRQTRSFVFPPGFMPNSGLEPAVPPTPYLPHASLAPPPVPASPYAGYPIYPATPWGAPTPLAPSSPNATPYIPSLPSPPPSSSRHRHHVRYAPLVEERTVSPIPIDTRQKLVYSTLVFDEHEWRQFIHPNGSLYWTCPVQRVVSDKHPHFDTISSLQLLLQSLHGFASWEVYLAENSAHFIDHGSRSMSSNRQMLPEFQMQIQQRHSNIETKFELEATYWMFVQSHPNHTSLPADAEDEAEEALLWCYADRRLFESSTAPFEKDAAQEMLGILQHVSAISRPTLKVWFISAIMRSVVQERSAAHYGTLKARNYRQLEKIDELPDFETFLSWWSLLIWHFLAWLAFGAPFGYLKRIINVNRSNGISTQRWQAFLRNLCAEWADSNLLSVVLVSGTVAMLAVPGLNGVAQIAAFSSILCALSAVLTGTLLISNHRGRMESSGRAAFLYFDYAKRWTGSPHILAILLSLPLTLTLWGMVWFVVSVVSSAYQPGLPNIPRVFETVLRFTAISVVCALAVVVAIVAWFFRTQRSSGQGVPSTKRPTSTSMPVPMPAPMPLTVPQNSEPLPFNWQQPAYPSYPATPPRVATYRNFMTFQHPSYWPQPVTQQTNWPQSTPMAQHHLNRMTFGSETDGSPPGWWQRLRDRRRRRYPGAHELSVPATVKREDFHASPMGNLSAAADPSWQHTAEPGVIAPGQFGPYPSMTTDPTIVQLLRDNRLAQLATADQQRELMRYLTGLNEWLERDVHDRQAELRGVAARVDQLRNDLHRPGTQMTVHSNQGFNARSRPSSVAPGDEAAAALRRVPSNTSMGSYARYDPKGYRDPAFFVSGEEVGGHGAVGGVTPVVLPVEMPVPEVDVVPKMSSAAGGKKKKKR